MPDTKAMKRREFLKALSAGAITLHAGSARAQPAETAESIYERSISIDAMCFGAAPPRNYVTFLTRAAGSPRIR